MNKSKLNSAEFEPTRPKTSLTVPNLNKVTRWQKNGPICPRHRVPSERHRFEIREEILRGWRCPVKRCKFEILHPKDADDNIRLRHAISQYRKQIVSLGLAAEMAKLPYHVMERKIVESGVPLNLGPASIAEAERNSKRLTRDLRKRLREKKACP